MLKFLVGWIVISTTCWLVVGVLIAPLVPGGGLAVMTAALVLSAPILILVRGFTRRTYPRRAVRLFVFRPFWYVQLILPFAMLAALAGMIAGAAAGAFNASPLEWAVQGGRAGVVAVLALAAMFFTAGYAGSRRLVVRHFTATLPQLPAVFDGLRIVQLSDLHVGPHTPSGKLARIAAETRAAAPDIIALTGDLVDDYARDVEPFAAGLGRLDAPMGVFAIPGNHDVYAGWSAVRRGLEAQGITVLVNDAVAFTRGNDRIALLGTGDPAGSQWHRDGGGGAAPDIPRGVDAARALAGAGGVIIALAHNPALWPPLARAGVALTLSGHTHWGQFALPGLRWSLASPFLEHAMGEYLAGDAMLYVHPGTNFWGLPFRLGTPAEVAIVTLRHGPATSFSAGTTELARSD